MNTCGWDIGEEESCSLAGSYPDLRCWHHSTSPEAVIKRTSTQRYLNTRRRMERAPRIPQVTVFDVASMRYIDAMALKMAADGFRRLRRR